MRPFILAAVGAKRCRPTVPKEVEVMQVKRKPVEPAAWAVLVVATIGIRMPIVSYAVRSVGELASLA